MPWQFCTIALSWPKSESVSLPALERSLVAIAVSFFLSFCFVWAISERSRVVVRKI